MPEKLLLVVGLTALCMLSPGPDMFLVMRNTLTVDRRCGGVTALGVLTGNVIHIGYCVAGIALLLSQSPSVFRTLRIASAGYLVYLGIQSLRARARVPLPSPTRTYGHPANAYWQGLFNNLLNPKGSLFYLGLFTQLVTPEMPFGQIALLIAAMLAVSASFWIAFVQALHLPVVRTNVQRWAIPVERAFGTLLIIVGLQVALLD